MPADLSFPRPWWSEFHSFTIDHAIALAWTLPLILISCWLGRRWLAAPTSHIPHPASRIDLAARNGFAALDGASKERQLCAAWAGFIICSNLWALVYWLQPAHYDITRSLPLHMCDIAGLLAPLLFLTHWRPIRAIMYFWGIGLSTQAFITPTLLEGIGEQRYWLFWLNHLAIVGSAVYDLIVRRFRPTARDYITTTIITLAWFAAVGLLNTKLGSNYGYNGNVKMDRPTIIDKLGPWPERAFLLAVIGIALFGVLWVVWPLTAKLRNKASSPQRR